MHSGECERYGIGDAEIAERLRFFQVEGDRDECVAQLGAIIGRHVDAIIESFYDYLLQTPALRDLLADGAKLKRLRTTQRAYILTLGQGRTAREYFERRLQIGRAHERVGLSPMYYLGAYAKLFEVISRHVIADAPSESSAELIITLERLFSLDIELALMTYHGRRHDAIVESVQSDALTGIASRGFALAALEREFGRANRFGRPFALLFIDIDNFKTLNDSEGHAAGDAALADVALCLRNGIRPHDLLGRYGGDEFLVGIIEGEPEVAINVAERIRAAVEARFRNRLHPLTTSIGAAHARKSDRLADLIQRADSAMYEAKSTGRNRVVSAFDLVSSRGQEPAVLPDLNHHPEKAPKSGP